MACLDNWEKFMHDIPSRCPTLIKAALLHVQFETIHPFLDGNGRVGRLLITLLLCYEKALSKPLLYLSLYFKTNRDAYYDLLQRVRIEGDWEAWLHFFLDGVTQTAEQATETAQAIFALIAKETDTIGRTWRTAGNTLRLHHWMQKTPVFGIAGAVDDLSLSTQTVINTVRRLQSLGIVKEVSGRQRNQVFVYDSLLGLISASV